MAKKIWDEPIGKSTPWDGDASTDNLPVRGRRIEEFIKGSLNSKIGELYYDTANNRYLAFADETDRDLYIADPTKTDLVLGAFDAPFNYTAEINLATPNYNAIFIGATGNYIDFTFDVKNKQGASTGESVIVKYSFIRGANKQEVSEIKPFGSSVHFNVDKYLAEGTNTVIVSVTGQNTLAATSVAITYEVVNLQLADELDISKAYDMTSGSAQVEIPYTISGYGTKIIEWYVDGVQMPYVKSEDEVVDSNTARVKRITLSNLAQGTHSLQFRAYTTVNGERFYTDTLYRDLLVYTGVNSALMIGIAMSIPREHGIVTDAEDKVIYGITQYIPYTLRFATYSPRNTSNVLVDVYVDGDIKSSLNTNNGSENLVTITTNTPGSKTVSIKAASTEYNIVADVAPTTMNIREITDALALNFTAEGKTNASPDKDVWTDGEISATLTGFAWNNTSGWVNNRLEVSAGSSIEFDYAPLANTPTNAGKTIEIEWSTKNVNNDDAVICDLRNDSGVGIVIYATKVVMTSADGVTIATEYKSDENVRIAFVINRASGSTNQCMSFIYANGIVSRGDKWAITDSYTSNAKLAFSASDSAEISLKSVRIYDAALSSDNILNNYTLYRDTIAEMMEVYDRNDVYEDERDVFSPVKMSSRLPVMIITGDIPTLENTSDKDTQIVVDIEYTNLQDPTKSFRMEGAAMRPQGTSSMGYPKKNFRIYTQKLDNTIVYDSTGAVIKDKLYSFKDGAQPVNCWCLKADYAESSGTHNTGIARLWNDALYNAQIDGEYKLRTEAQRIAAKGGYKYDVRTTIDGFPILLFYRPSANDDVIFIGKYNFNNDKSTESVFGFEGIPDFDNSKMQCWEVLNNGNPLALFTTTANFDTQWSEAFESRYPDTKYPDISSLKSFAQWMSTVSDSDFAAQKWEHMDVYKMAAYWVYLMRHAAADQFVKNAMFTSEDGQHFYYILYDNDTINGLINTGHLEIRPTDTRQTVDDSGSYVFAGHDSRLWNMLEADEEFINIVSVVDNALYSAGISYANTIKIFDDEQADKWVEKVYNQDATYKYISPYVEKGINNLFMLQGKRDLHRRWWLAKRFAIYDAKYVSGQYKSLSVELKCINGTPAGQEFTVTAGYPIDYGYGINNLPRKFGVSLDIGESYTFSTSEVVNLGDPIRIYGAPNIAALDLSKMADRLAVVTISNVYEKALGTRLTKLVVGSPTANNLQVNEISGLRQALMLDYLDVQGMQALTSLDLSAQSYFKTLKAHNSGIASVTFAKGAPVERLELPASMRVLSLEQLPYITTDNIVLEDTSNISGMIIRNCPNASNKFTFVYDWYNKKSADDSMCTLVMDNINWSGVKGNQLALIANIALKGGTLDLKGHVKLTQITKAQSQTLIKAFGPNVFNEDSDFYVDAPVTLTLTGPSSILEGENAQYDAEVYPPIEGSLKYSLATSRTGCSIDANTGALTTVENGLDTSNIVVRATFTPANGEAALIKDISTSVVKRTYLSNATINGNNNPIVYGEYTWSTTSTNTNGDITVSWALSGDITEYVSMSSQDRDRCNIIMTYPPLGIISGTLTLTIKKAYNSEIVVTATKSLSAEMKGVIITGRSNAPIQAALYAAGLVANETYTLRGEAEAITATDLQPGSTDTTSIFYPQKNNIKSFDEFRYFTGIVDVLVKTFMGCTQMTSITFPNTVVSIGNYALSGCSSLVNIQLPSSLQSIGASTFSSCVSLKNLVLPEGVKSLSSNTFINCSRFETISIPSTTTTIGGNVFMGCGLLDINVSENNNSFSSLNGVLYNKDKTRLIEYAKDKVQPVYVVPEGVTHVGNYAFYYRDSLESITLPSTLKALGNDMFSKCKSLKTIICNSIAAPTLANASIFGAATNDYTGRSTYNTGENKLYIPVSATGYETSYWLDPLQNASKCGFTIHGKLIINSNRSNATFSVSYTTESGSTKSVSVGVGTSYISDIKYNTSVTIKPNALSGYTWDSNSVSFTYSAASNIATLNAYAYPTNATISGDTNPVNNPVYTWTTTTANVDGEYTATWALSGDITSYMSIASQSKDSCKLSTIEVPTEEISGTLSITITPKIGNAVTATKALKAILPGVVITSKSNAPIQAALYAARLVANEAYSLQSELEKITSTQLQPGTSSSTSIFYSQKGNIETFDEFKYFTSVLTVPKSLFFTYSKLRSISLPDSITEICSQAFEGCSSLDSLLITPNVSSIEPNAFTDCHNVDFTVSSSNTSYSSVNGVLYNKAKTKVVRCANDQTSPTHEIPSGVTEIGDRAFARCEYLTSVTIPSGVTKIGAYAFYLCSKITSLVIPDTVTNLSSNYILGSCSQLKQVTISKNATTLGDGMFNGCVLLNTIYINNPTAPTVYSKTFGNSSIYYAGIDSTVANRLRIPLESTGYEGSYWLDPLQNSSKGKFTIHGKITIASNKSNATFNIAYISEGDVNKTVTVGVGTFYINDVKYGTSMTVTPNALSGYTWDKASTTITYNGATTVTLNAYIYPTSVTISGDSEILGGKRNSYYASVAPSNIDIGISYNWTIEGSTNVSIESYSGNSCTLKAEDVENDDNCKLICTVETTDGKIINSSISIAIKVYRNLITLVYGTASGSQYVLGTSYDVANILYMEKNGSKITPSNKAYLSTTIQTTFKVALKTMAGAFRSCTNLISVDFSEFDGTGYDSMAETFYNCPKLTSISWGECKFPNMKSLYYTFDACSALTNIDLSPFEGAPISSLSGTFYDCKAVTHLDLTPLSGAPITEIDDAFRNCETIKSLDLSALDGIIVSTPNALFWGCRNLESIDLTPLRNSTLDKPYGLFYYDQNLKTIIMPWKTAFTPGPTTFGGSASSYVGYNTRSTGQNRLYVPADSVGYDTSSWKSTLCNSSYCGFTLSKTL